MTAASGPTGGARNRAISPHRPPAHDVSPQERSGF
ncbi:hypothetical protein M2156_001902 [Streptomyces sp. SAI-149]|nr:hypothetical protein [Streptomyces sp. SAI-119]MDH6495683.1 hypothetical protein [Streptomyces sp. SAI-149]